MLCGVFKVALEYVCLFLRLIYNVFILLRLCVLVLLNGYIMLALNITLLFNEFYVLPLYIIALWCPLRFLSSKWLKGKIGEYRVTKKIKKALKDNDYKLINDVTLEYEDGTTQIDHILIMKNEIIVIETKNFRGEIFASKNDFKWTLKLGRFTYPFYSPLKQNHHHIKILANKLSLNISDFTNVIVFVSGRLRTSQKLPKTVVRLKHLPLLLSTYSDLSEQRYDIDELARKIELVSLPRGFRTDIKHISNLRDHRLKKVAKASD